jgi:hypothetical protein
MPAAFADRVYLAALGSEDVSAAFGEGYETANEPPAVSSLLRSLADTHAWATRDTDVLATMERGDYVLFHRDWGLRYVAQVWATTADSDAVARHTEVSDPAGEWGLVTLTNVQPALDHVSLLSLDAEAARSDDSLYQFSTAVSRDLRERFGTAARLVEETVENPLEFDVPPGGTPPDRRPESPTTTPGGTEDEPGRLPTPGTFVDAHLDSLAAVRTSAWRVLGLGAFLLAATLVVIGRYRPTGGDPFVLTAAVAAGVGSLAVGAAFAAAVALQGTISPRPGLGALTREYTGAVQRANANGETGHAAAHLAARVQAYCRHVDARTRRYGLAVAAGAVGVLAGNVLVAYGLLAQVSTSLDTVSVVPLVAFPVLVVAATVALARRSLRQVLPDRSAESPPAAKSTESAFVGRLDAIERRLNAFVTRFR